ncbi:MAG: cytoplasmic protein [Candidatus Cloacimonadota bacterium]|nr:MAG: cytoplasmic protein [Candidatus Cloacimonadota bacterium]PIE81757.1 MAG: cytoplasmic protein [Candidatus Delongbacteria bacterium]
MKKERPILDKKIDVQDFKDFYWLKEELVKFCRKNGISYVGGKIEITDRIIEYLETGKIRKPKTTIQKKLPKPTKLLTLETIIGVDYRSYKEKKEFLQSIIGKQFHFTIHLLEFFKQNIGKKTYGDLVDEWYNEQKLKSDPNFVKEIAPQFEYNSYIRDFMKANPNMTKKDAIKYWKLKKSISGDNKYSEKDLELDK